MSLFDPLPLRSGRTLKNRLALAPLTNQQSHADGRLSEDERRWLLMRAEGGFGLVMTCAAHVQRGGQGFPGQLGAFSDALLPGLTSLADGIRAAGALSVLQLHHAGIRAPAALIGEAPVGPSADPETGARALSLEEVEALRDDFVAAAVRARAAGFEGVEIHGAHGYVLAQFLSPEINRRKDRYGGSLENRTRLIREILNGVRRACGADFTLGLRLSPERFGLRLAEIREFAEEVLRAEVLDFLDMSLWDFRKAPQEGGEPGGLLGAFASLDRRGTRLGAAGKILTGADARDALDRGCDFVLVGRGAILHHDFAERLRADPDFVPRPLPVPAETLAAEGLGPAFVDYMRGWKGFVVDPS